MATSVCRASILSAWRRRKMPSNHTQNPLQYPISSSFHTPRTYYQQSFLWNFVTALGPENPFKQNSAMNEKVSSPTAISSRPDSHLTFRLKGINKGSSKEEIEKLVKATLSVDEGTGVCIHSLAADPCQSDAMVATLSFQKLPEDFLSNKGKGEWCVPVPEHLHYAPNHHLFFDTKFHGFTPLHTCDEEDCQMDLIALTGLNGHAFGSFKQKEGTFMWLRDSLPNDLPGVRILLYGYDTELQGSSSFQGIKDVGNRFSNAVRTVRAPTTITESKLERPLVLIGHSLGGIIIKEAIIHMPTADPQEQINFQSIIGILFFGVPNTGLHTSHLRGMVKGQPNEEFIKQCSSSTTYLFERNWKFMDVFSSRNAEIISFYETEMSPTPKELPGGRWVMSTDRNDRRVLVPPSSAICSRLGKNDIEKYTHPINRTHSDLVKFRSQHDEDYHEVRFHLRKFQMDVSTFSKQRRLSEKCFTPEQQDCLQSLAFIEQEWREQEIWTARNTCDWVLTHKHFTAWLTQDQGLLWLRGHPASGKSTLMKYAWTAMKHKSEESDSVVASFFFHGRGLPIQRNQIGLFRSLLNQILPQFPEVLQKFSGLHQEHIQERGKRWEWGGSELRDFFISNLPAASKARPIVIFVDALDEAFDEPGRPMDSELAHFFVRLMTEVEKHDGRLKICFSSRHYPGVINMDLGNARSISVDDENDDDIRSAVSDRLKNVDLPDDRRQILEQEIVSRANGIFQWAMLVTRDVFQKCRARENFSVICQSIKKTPYSLHSLYADILKDTRSKNQAQSLKLLQWVCFAERPLSTLELQHALALDADMEHIKVKHYMSDDKRFPEDVKYMRDIIGKLSSGLVEVVKHNNTMRAQFIHQAVRDYLLKEGLDLLAPCTDSKKAPVMAGAKAEISPKVRGLFQISRSGIKYLNLKDMRKHVQYSPAPDELFTAARKFPLAAYALSSMKTHLRDLDASGADQSDLLSLFCFPNGDQRILATWCALAERLDVPRRTLPVREGTRLVHLLAECGVASALRKVLVRMKDSDQLEGIINAKDAIGMTPVAYAALEGHVDVVRLLVDAAPKGFALDDPDAQGNTPLIHAAEWGRVEVVKMLLETGQVDVNARNKWKQTAIWKASVSGHVKVVEVLLESGAEHSSPFFMHSSPLAEARRNGKEEVVKMLREVGALE